MSTSHIRIKWAKERIKTLWPDRNFNTGWRRSYIKCDILLIRKLEKEPNHVQFS